MTHTNSFFFTAINLDIKTKNKKNLSLRILKWKKDFCYIILFIRECVGVVLYLICFYVCMGVGGKKFLKCWFVWGECVCVCVLKLSVNLILRILKEFLLFTMNVLKVLTLLLIKGIFIFMYVVCIKKRENIYNMCMTYTFMA